MNWRGDGSLGEKLHSLSDEVLEVPGGIRLQQERQPLNIRCEKLHRSLRLLGPAIWLSQWLLTGGIWKV